MKEIKKTQHTPIHSQTHLLKHIFTEKKKKKKKMMMKKVRYKE